MKKEVVKTAMINLPDQLNQGNSAFLQAIIREKLYLNNYALLTYKLFFKFL